MSFDTKLAEYPRILIGQFPTPLEPLPRLTQVLGGPHLWVKRDDTVGPAMGGSKTRQLEFLFGEAQAKRAQIVATFGGLQSNFARQMCAVARSLGVEPHCFYFARRPTRLEGNLLLAQLLGAHLHFIPFGGGSSATMTPEQAARLVRWIVRLTPACWGRRVYFMPVGGHTPLGCLGYVLAAMEIENQLRAHGIERATIVTASGTGATLAGLLAGFHLLRSRHALLGTTSASCGARSRLPSQRLRRRPAHCWANPITFRPGTCPSSREFTSEKGTHSSRRRRSRQVG
ncbi:MAG TPA: pyridoxal-phosphate dependent enzyme [Anaerolineae bacterium]|nr:pyridoxal-phosphate dependent enzyme [Anaerolineae bacterium]